MRLRTGCSVVLLVYLLVGQQNAQAWGASCWDAAALSTVATVPSARAAAVHMTAKTRLIFDPSQVCLGAAPHGGSWGFSRDTVGGTASSTFHVMDR